MTRFHVHLTGLRPDCRLALAFVWGDANLDTEGDSNNPASREWMELYAQNRDRPAEVFDVFPASPEPLVLEDESQHEWHAAAVAYLLAESTKGTVSEVPSGPLEPVESLLSRVGEFDVEAAWARYWASPFHEATLEKPCPNRLAARYRLSWRWVWPFGGRATDATSTSHRRS